MSTELKLHSLLQERGESPLDFFLGLGLAYSHVGPGFGQEICGGPARSPKPHNRDPLTYEVFHELP